MPFGEDVLVVGPEVGRVRGDRGRSFTPDRLLAGSEGGVGDTDRDCLGGVSGEVAPSDVADLVLGVAVATSGRDRAEPGVGAVGVDREHQPFGQHFDR